MYVLRLLRCSRVVLSDPLPLQCAPAVAEFTAARKRAWSQRVLATGQPSILEGEDLFSQETLDASPNKQVMECSPVEDGAHVSNNTCVLSI